MAIHQLKIDDPFFTELLLNKKKFEIRKDDRNFKTGDILILRLYDADKKYYTGCECRRKVTEVYRNLPGLEAEYVILQIEESYYP